MPKIDTPCVGICSTVYGDDVCRGCKRYYDEVIDWNLYSEEQKADIYQRLGTQATHVVSQFLEVTDPERLIQSLNEQSIRYRLEHTPATWVLQWLRFTRVDKPWDDVGLAPLPPYQGMTRLALFIALDKALYDYASQD